MNCPICVLVCFSKTSEKISTNGAIQMSLGTLIHKKLEWYQWGSVGK